jgi:adenylyltransferase/sulfurtransferase
MLISNWGEEGQARLKRSTVTVAGAGGLGCPASTYLAAAGVGRIRLIDNDFFELNNLNRQILGWERDLGRAKTEACKEKLSEFNSDIEIEAINVKINEKNVMELIEGSDVVVDAMDNWNTRFILNRSCVELKIPFIHAGIYGLSGQVTTIVPGKGPCLKCIIPVAPPEVRPFPVFGATPGLFAMIQVMEVMKLLIGLGKPLIGRILLFSGEDMSFHVVDVLRNPQCLVCRNL